MSPPAQSDAPGCPGAEEFLKTILVDDSRISFIPPCSNNKETVRHSEVVANSQELWTLETFVFSEVLKQASWSGESCALYHYRDKDQDEVDLVIETGSGALVGIEVKASAIDERDALALHDRLLALHGGAVGLRDDGLLKSALARPQPHFVYAESPDIVNRAAAYTWGIVRNHPFVDGNKRTGFVLGVLFLELNGYRFSAREEDAAQAVLELARGNLDEAGYIAFLRANASLGKK